MPFNPENPTDLSTLATAIDWSRWRLQAFRQNRYRLIKAYCGSNYSWSGVEYRQPLNMLLLAANIYLRNIVSRAPQAMCGGKGQELAPICADMEAWFNKQAVPGMRLDETLRLWALSGLFGRSIIKCATSQVGSIVAQNGTTIAVGQPFAEVISEDDFAHDMFAKRWDQIQWAANRYSVVYEEARDNQGFDPEERAKLMPQTNTVFNERGDPRTTTISQSTSQNYDGRLQEHVELWDVWLPREQLILTIPYADSAGAGFAGKKPLKIVKWTGPPQGPFIPLSFIDAPDQVMPVAPLGVLKDLHDLVNVLAVKLGDQGERQKELLLFRGIDDDVNRIARTRDGGSCRVDMVDQVKQFAWGGIKPENVLGMTEMINRFDEMGGNLRTLGGLATQAGTLGQEELLNANSSAQIKDMQARMIAATRTLYTHIFWHWWTNPVLSYQTTREAQGHDVAVSVTPQMRSVPFNKLGFNIDPYSMADQTPQTKLAAIMELVQTILVPMGGAMAQQGITINWKGIIDAWTKYRNITDIGNVITQGPPPDQQQTQEAMGAVHERVQALNTTRTNVRKNVPGRASPQGQGNIMAKLLAGGAQQSEAQGVR